MINIARIRFIVKTVSKRDTILDFFLTDKPLQCLKDLVAIQKDGEAAVQEYIKNSLENHGCTMRYFDYLPSNVPVKGEFSSDNINDERPRRALVAEAKGDPNLPSLLIFAHPDSELVREIEQWRSDPFVPTEIEGRLFGWGVADDLAGCACAIAAIKTVLHKNKTHLGSIIFASTPSKNFARGVSALLHAGLTADASLYLHPAESGRGLSEIKAIASGQLEFIITIHGKPPDTTEPGHTAFSHLAENPIEKAFLVANALVKLNEVRNQKIMHKAIHCEVGRSTNLHISRIVSNEENRLSRINKTCTLGGAISFPPKETLEETKNEIEQAIEKMAQNDPWLRVNPPELKWLSGVTGGEVDMSSPFYKIVSSSVKEVTSQEPFVNPMHTSSDIKNPIVEADIPCLGLGCLGGNLSQNNQTDEWVDISDFNRMVDVTAKVIERWCGNEQNKRPNGHSH